MLKPIEGGSIEHIQGLDCWIPKPPEPQQIAGYFLEKIKAKVGKNRTS
jgi:hypothetical protein